MAKLGNLFHCKDMLLSTDDSSRNVVAPSYNPLIVSTAKSIAKATQDALKPRLCFGSKS